MDRLTLSFFEAREDLLRFPVAQQARLARHHAVTFVFQDPQPRDRIEIASRSLRPNEAFHSNDRVAAPH